MPEAAVAKLRLILLGPPGCGKGTQGKKLESFFEIPQLSTGDMLRAAANRGTEIGLKAKRLMDGGNLVPDDMIVGVMKERMSQPDCTRGFILDGFPRTLVQADALDRIFAENGQKLDAVVSFNLSDEEVVTRLSGRRQCKACGSGYHVLFKKPAAEGRCDLCGGELYVRDDDHEATIRGRLKVYHQQTAPLIDYYKQRGLLRSVSGRGEIDDVFEQIRSLIQPGTAGVKRTVR